MVRPRPVSATLAVASCVFVIQSSVPLFAGEEAKPLSNPSDLTTQATRLLPNATRPFLKPEFGPASEQVRQGVPYPYTYSRRHDGSIAAIMFGAAGVITGSALLVYASRPECSVNQAASGCGYGPKVIGTSVLTGGVVGLMVGALTWR